jgi:nitrite reductase (NADH) small subunit
MFLKGFACRNQKALVEYGIDFPAFRMQPALIKIGTRADLPAPGKVKEFMADRRFICVANVDGDICAMDNVCPHWGGPLGQGRIENGKIVCPWHGWSYDPKTGETPRKAGVRLTIFKLRMEHDDVFVEL